MVKDNKNFDIDSNMRDMFDKAKKKINRALHDNVLIPIPLHASPAFEVGDIRRNIAAFDLALGTIEKCVHEELEAVSPFFLRKVSQETRKYCEDVLDSIISKLKDIRDIIVAEKATDEISDDLTLHLNTCLARVDSLICCVQNLRNGNSMVRTNSAL